MHDQVQYWGEGVLPLLYEETSDRIDRLKLFEYLMASVERGDTDVAHLIQDHEMTMQESTRSWYSGKVSALGQDRREEMIRHQFLTWLKIYKAGP